MKHIVIPQIRAITGDNPQDAALRFNETMLELAPLHPTFQREGDTYYIQYSVMIDEPESLADERKLKGEHHKCGECQHCIRDINRFGDIDARKVWGTCALTGVRVRIRGDVCDEYYRERGE